MSLVTDREKLNSTTAIEHYDVTVVGAGPYGLSAAAHLLDRNVKVAVFGKPLKLWREHMPQGMCLRSHWRASDLSDPQKKYTFEQFLRASPYEMRSPMPIEAFIEYGLWFQRHAVPDVDETYVSSIQRNASHFLLTLVDGRVVQSRAVIMAPGLYYYANRPAEWKNLPSEIVSHTVEHNNFARFAGKRVVVLGAGQSAVESAALLHEVGAAVELVCRRPIHWLEPDSSQERSLWEKLREPTAGIAPGWKNWILEYLPYLFYRFPQEKKDRYINNHYTAAASDWLRDRVVGKVVLHEGERVQEMREHGDGLELQVSDGKVIQADHVLLATGYRVNIKRLPMLDQSLLAAIAMDRDVPVLNPWFESSVPGLYFIGITSLQSFGPLYRFVVGTKAAAQRVAGAAVRQSVSAKRR
jgi:thioredoxin reductase